VDGVHLRDAQKVAKGKFEQKEAKVTKGYWKGVWSGDNLRGAVDGVHLRSATEGRKDRI
jgi:hypothetical protein